MTLSVFPFALIVVLSLTSPRGELFLIRLTVNPPGVPVNRLSLMPRGQFLMKNGEALMLMVGVMTRLGLVVSPKTSIPRLRVMTLVVQTENRRVMLPSLWVQRQPPCLPLFQ